jgi:hypothetical protein
MAFTLVQKTAFASSASASVNQSYSSNNTAGSLLVAMIYSPGGSASTYTVTDTQGNTWFAAGISDISLTHVFFCPSAKAGANTVTASVTGANPTQLSLAEYTGHNSSHPVSCASQYATSAGAQPTIGIVTPNAGSLIIWVVGTNGGGVTWSSITGFTAQTATTTVPVIWGDNESSSAGLNTLSANIGASPDFIGKAVAFNPSGVTLSGPTLVRPFEIGNGGGSIVLQSGTSPLTGTFPGGNENGNTIFVGIQQLATSTDQVTAVTDSAGNSYSKLAGLAIADNQNFSFYSFWGASVTHGSNTNNTVSVAFSSGTIIICAVEFFGVNTTLDVSAHDNGSYTITAAKSGELLLTMNGTNASTPSWSSLSGTDITAPWITGTQSRSPELNYFTSSAGSNSIAATSSTGLIGSLTIAQNAQVAAAIAWTNHHRKFINLRNV